MKAKKRVVAVILTAVMCMLFATACSKAKPNPADAKAGEDAFFEIETAYGTIHYPAKWQDQVRTESADDSVTFYGTVEDKPEQLLFVLKFGESDGVLLGSLNGTNVSIAEGSPEFDDSWSEAEKNEIYAMQDDVNVIMEQDLSLPVEEAVETYTVDSAVGKLEYPVRWKDHVRTETTDSTISFYGTVEGKPEQLLFTLEFGDSDGYKLGTMNGTDVSIIEGKLAFDDTWTDEQRQMMADMQDAVNTILEGLRAQSGFSSVAG